MTTPQGPQGPQASTTTSRPDDVDVDERQPLLGASESDSPNTTPNDPEAVLDVEDKKRDWKRTATQIVLVLLGAAILGIFVKSFLDADDVEVWFLDQMLPKKLSKTHFGIV
jgi:hypothetical protein